MLNYNYLLDQSLKSTATVELINAVYGKTVSENKCQFSLGSVKKETPLSWVLPEVLPQTGRSNDFY